MNIPDYVRQYIHDFAEMEGYENADNYRAYNLDTVTPEQEDEYWKAHDSGCCGFYDNGAHNINGERWMIGFNYGH